MSETSYKICVLGESAVGKSAIVDVFLGRQPETEKRVRSGARVETGLVATPSGPRELIIWDVLCADGGFAFETPYLAGMNGALIVCDRTRRPTVTASRALLKRIDDEFPAAASVIAINKCDLSDQAEVSEADIQELRATGVTVVEVSTTTGQNVKDAFESLAAQVNSHG